MIWCKRRALADCLVWVNPRCLQMHALSVVLKQKWLLQPGYITWALLALLPPSLIWFYVCLPWHGNYKHSPTVPTMCCSSVTYIVVNVLRRWSSDVNTRCISCTSSVKQVMFYGWRDYAKTTRLISAKLLGRMAIQAKEHGIEFWCWSR